MFAAASGFFYCFMFKIDFNISTKIISKTSIL